MTITTTKKVLKLVSSWGNTLPQKELKRAGVELGDDIRITIEVLPKKEKHEKLIDEYDAFVKQYDKTLKNLAER